MKKIAKREVHNAISVPKQRFVALDVVRGITMALMIICNNPGGDAWSFLDHAEWVGFTLADAVFPAFMTCMGFAMVFSLKHIEKIDWLFVRKVILRGLLLILIGWILEGYDNLLGKICNGATFVQAMTEICQTFRFFGVLFRFGFVSLFASAIIVLTKKNVKVILGIAGGLILAYFFILGFGHGYEFSKQNVCYIVDQAICGDAHLCHLWVGDVTLGLDPEGFLGNIPCIGQVLLTYCIGKIFMEKREKSQSNSILWLFVVSALLILTGIFCSSFSPFIKKVWTSSFVFLTTGITMMMVSIFAYFTRKKEHKKGLYAFNALGANSLGVYIIAAIFEYTFNNVKVGGDQSIREVINDGFGTICGTNVEAASFMYAMLVLIIVWIIALILYKKKIFIRL